MVLAPMGTGASSGLDARGFSARLVLDAASELRAIEVEDPRDRSHGQTDKPKERRRPANAQSLVHLEREQREHAANNIAGKVVRPHGGRRPPCAIGIRQV